MDQHQQTPGFRSWDVRTMEHHPAAAAVNTLPPLDMGAAEAELDALERVEARVRSLRASLLKDFTRRVIVLPAVALLAVLVGVFSPAAVPSAAAATTAGMGIGLNLRAAPHHDVSGFLHAGFWTVRGTDGRAHQAVCISYNRRGPDGVAQTLSAPLPTPSREADARLKTVINMFGGTRDAHVAAQLWFAAAHILVDDPAARSADAAALRADLPFYERQIPAVDRVGWRAMVAAAAVHGPYTVVVSVQAAVPGQAGRAVVTVRGSSGAPAGGRQVAWAVTGGVVVSAGRVTNAAGQAVVAFRAARLRQAVTAVVTAASSSTVWVNRPSTGRQVVVGGGFLEVTRGSGAGQVCPVSASHRTSCPCQHAGARDVTVTFTADDLPGFYTGYVLVAGQPAGQVAVEPGGSADLVVHVQPGDDVEVGYRVYGTADRAGAPLVAGVLDGWTQR